jgi:hypothetical protein
MFILTAYRSKDIKWSVAVDTGFLKEHAASVVWVEEVVYSS